MSRCNGRIRTVARRRRADHQGLGSRSGLGRWRGQGGARGERRREGPEAAP